MSFYGSQTQPAMPPMQMQMQMQVQMRMRQMQTNRPIANQQMNQMAGTRNLPYQNLQQPGNAVQGGAPNGADKTLDLQLISVNLDPSVFSQSAPSLYPSLVELHSKLPIEDAAFLKLVECFTFLYRIRGPHEPNVMPNAHLYFTRLKSFNSPLYSHIDQVVGFRCCGCRHTTHSPRDYKVGAAQLLSVQYFSPKSVVKSLAEIRSHIKSCPFVSDMVKQSLSAWTAKNGEHSSLDEYLGTWSYALTFFAQAKGYPPLKRKENNASSVQSGQPRTSFTGPNGSNGMGQTVNAGSTHGHSLDPSVGVLKEALGTAQKRQRQLQQHFALQQQGIPGSTQRGSAAQTSTSRSLQIPAAPNAEDELFSDLEGCLVHGLVENNFGLATFRSRRVFADLSQLPIHSSDVPVSPLLEILLQSFCPVQRWTSGNHAGKKRSNNQMTQIPQAHVFFECAYCNDSSRSFCATTGSAREAAAFIVSSGYRHLSDECNKAPSSLKQRLVKLKSRTRPDQSDRQARIVEENYRHWQRSLPGLNEGIAQPSKQLAQVKFWRPLTWRFLQETGGAAARTDTLACDDVSVVLQGKADKKLPYATRDDDVLIGWNGPHVGNRRFIELLHEFRPVFLDETASPVQQKVIAATTVQIIAARGGRFYSVGPNYIMAPTLLPSEKSISFTLRAFKYGAMVLIKPPQDHNRTGRGSCVLESENMPQRDVFSKEIVRNKRFKRLAEGE